MTPLYTERTISDIHALRWHKAVVGTHEAMAALALLDGPCSMGQLAAKIPLSRPAVTALTDRLEAAGTIYRAPHFSDRRQTTLNLTEAGRSCVSKALFNYNHEAS